MRAVVLPWVLAACLVAPRTSAVEAMLGVVEGVTENNSLSVAVPDGRRQVVLAYLSIPRPPQAYAERAGAVLRAQLLGRTVNLRPVGRQGPDFTNALVYVGTRNFNADYLERGHAWVNPLDHPAPHWRRLEAQARARGAGLWGTPDPIHPIDFEYGGRAARYVRDGLQHIASDPLADDMQRSALVGDTRTRRYYAFGCTAWTRIPEQNVLIFTSPARARAEGFTPAADCAGATADDRRQP